MASMANCPAVGPDAVLCCRAAVLSMSQQSMSWPEAPKPSAAANVFSTRAPRDAIAGASSGLKTFARSLAAGSAALICGPLEAARDGGGVTGTLRGACEGVASAALIPCAGAVVAAGQFARGVAVTPQALVESLRGQRWSKSERCWKPHKYSLAEEAASLQSRKSKRDKHRKSRRRHAEEDADDDGSGKGGVRVHGREYYKLLRVTPSADPVEIRRAYYRESRRCHPDKAGTDPLTVERFHQLSQAYQVLRSSELREAYDAGGQDAVARLSATIDLGALYAAVLSGPQWEPFVGQFSLRWILSGQEDSSGADILDSLTSVWLAPSESPSTWQAEREVRCAQALAKRLEPAMSSDEALRGEWLVSMRREADELAAAPFASALLLSIAEVYANEATRFLGAFDMRVLTAGRELMQAYSRGRLCLQQARAVASGTRAVFALRSLIAEEGPGAPPSADTPGSAEPRATTLCLEKPAVQEQLPLLAAALWHLTALDVEGTLRRVCRRVLADASLEVDTRRQRAEALLLLAATFREAANAHGNTGSPGEDRTLLLDKVSETALRMASAGKGRSNGESGEA